MKFTQISHEPFGAKNAGYTFDFTAPRQHDAQLLSEIAADWGENYAESLFDGFYDLDGDLYQGEDGEYYAVTFRGDRPLVWQRLIRSAE